MTKPSVTEGPARVGRGRRRPDEEARADDGADAERDERRRPERALEPPLGVPGLGLQVIERLSNPEVGHEPRRISQSSGGMAPRRGNGPRPQGTRPRPRETRPRPQGTRPRPRETRPRPRETRPRPRETRPRPRETRPRPRETRPRPRETRPRPRGTRPRPRGTRPRPRGTRPRPQGTRPPCDGPRPRPRGLVVLGRRRHRLSGLESRAGGSCSSSAPCGSPGRSPAPRAGSPSRAPPSRA